MHSLTTSFRTPARPHVPALFAACLVGGVAAPALGQSLFQSPAPAAPVPSAPAPASPETPGDEPTPPPAPAPAPPAAPSLSAVSLTMVIPPKPKTWQKHDKVEVIINQTSAAKFEQSLDTDKQYDLKAELSQFPSIMALFEELALRDGIGGTKPSVGVNHDQKFKGDGTYERTDKLTARISGLVVDVKPNGLLVVEATESVSSDEEVKTMVLSGIVDPKDITTAGTVQSSQMASLVIKVQHQGQVKRAGEKGLIPRFFETVFNF